MKKRTTHPRRTTARSPRAFSCQPPRSVTLSAKEIARVSAAILLAVECLSVIADSWAKVVDAQGGRR